MTLDRTTLFLWWGPDAQDNDCVASANGQALTWPAAERAWDSAALNGWPGTETGTLPDQILDLDPALAWLRQTRAQLDPSAGLNLWNIAGDVAYSTGLAWHDRSRLRDSCYDKLVAANIPWLVGQDAYTPRTFFVPYSAGPRTSFARPSRGSRTGVSRLGHRWTRARPSCQRAQAETHRAKGGLRHRRRLNLTASAGGG